MWVISKTKVGSRETYGLMLMMLFVWKGFTKSISKLVCKTNTFCKIFTLLSIQNICEQTLVNLVTVKVHDYSKAFKYSVVVTTKKILWRRARSL